MFGNFINFLKKFSKEEKKDSKDTAKERLHLVLMQDRANVSADFMELMKQEIIEVIKKYIDIDENAIDVKLTNKVNGDGTTGAPILYANIPILNVKDDTKQINIERNKDSDEKEVEKKEEKETQNKNQEENQKENQEEKSESSLEDMDKKAEEPITFLKLRSEKIEDEKEEIDTVNKEIDEDNNSENNKKIEDSEENK